MAGWISRFFGGGKSNKQTRTANGNVAESQGVSSSRRRKSRKGDASVPSVTETSFQRLEIDVGPLSSYNPAPEPEPEYDEKRQVKNERRTGEDRRGGPVDRRIKDIPEKVDRRKNIWDRRRKFGERRFNPDRRERRNANAPRPYDMPASQPQPTALPPRPETETTVRTIYTEAASSEERGITSYSVEDTAAVPAAFSVPASFSRTPFPEHVTPPPSHPHPALEPGKLALLDSNGATIGYIRSHGEPQGGGEIDILEHESMEERVLHFDTPDGRIHFRSGSIDQPLDLPSVWPQEQALTITPYGNVTLHLSRMVRGYIVLAAEKRTVNLFQAVRKKPSTTTLVLKDIGADVERLGPLTCRFGGVRFYFDLTQTVELLDDSGKTWRISGPSGVNNFEEYRREVIPPMEGK